MPVTAHKVTAQGAGQGLDPRVAKSHGCSSPPVRVDGRVRDPLEDWIRKDAALAGTFSVQQPGVDRTRPGLQLVEVVQAAVAAQVAGRVDDGLDPQRPAVFEVLLDPGVLVEGVDGDLGAPGDDLGLELARVARCRPLRIRRSKMISMVSGRPRSRLSVTSASKNPRA